MNEHPRGEPLGRPFQEPDGGPYRDAAEQAVEHALFGEDAIEIAVYVKGRMIHTKTDAATVARIMAILTGMGA
jgi:hypothetical protein